MTIKHWVPGGYLPDLLPGLRSVFPALGYGPCDRKDPPVATHDGHRVVERYLFHRPIRAMPDEQVYLQQVGQTPQPELQLGNQTC